MKQWFAAHTQPQKEMVARKNLLAQGFEVYLPQYKRTRRHARKVETILSPLFPRYIFVGLDLEREQWRSVNGTRGISYLLMTNDRPVSVPCGIIARLKSQENEQGLLPVESLIHFMKGDSVRIVEGVFAGYTAIFEKMDGKQRVALLLSFLGRETKVVLSAYAVEAA
ncbi:MAG: transcriptional activator RfaH [Alphaproteobacteria bacterium]|nr:transcriptional activator RfaH [Alphaproteobacteria bacterium]